MREVSRAYVLRYYKIYKKQQSAKNYSSLAKRQETLKMCEKAILALISAISAISVNLSLVTPLLWKQMLEARKLHRGS